MSLTFSLRNPVGKTSETLDHGIVMPGTNGKAFILVHGLTGAPNEMSFIAWYLNSEGYTVHCPRLAHHGEPMQVIKEAHWEEFYQSVKDCFIEVHKTCKVVYVGGLSMGALLALELAAEFPNEVAGVSCLSPTFFYDGWNVPWYQMLLPLVAYTGFGNYFYFKEQPPYGLKSERLRQKVHAYYQHASLSDLNEVEKYGYPFFPVRLLVQLKQLIRHVKPRLRLVTCPCQVIQARQDDMSSPKNAVFVIDNVSSKRKEIFYLENSYHVITADQERGKVGKSIVDFFNQEAARG
jgi:carboxylesterase